MKRQLTKNLKKPPQAHDPQVTALFNTLRQIQLSPYPLSVRLKAFVKYLKIPSQDGTGPVQLEDWQVQDLCLILTKPESAVCWSRRIGKTFCMSILALWLAVEGKHGLFLVAGMDQLIQPKLYWATISLVTNVQEEWVFVNYEPMIHLNCLTDKNARSSGNQWVIFDEEGAIDSNKQYLVHVASITVRNYTNSRIIHVSTAKRGTTFEENFFRLFPLGCTSYHTYLDVQGVYIDKTKIEQDKAIMPLWLWEQEYLCKWVAVGGSIFHNLEECSDLSSYKPTAVGIDWNKSGHTLVFIHRNESDKVIYILKEQWIDPQTHLTGLNLSFIDSIQKQYPGITLYVEDGGYNEAWAIESSARYGAVKVQPTPVEKSARLMESLRYTLKIDKTTCPFLTKELKSAGWDTHKMTYLKDVTHTCHYLDAFMNTCIPYIPGSPVFIPAGSVQTMDRQQYLIQQYQNQKNRGFF